LYLCTDSSKLASWNSLHPTEQKLRHPKKMNHHHATNHPFAGEDYNHHAMQMNVNDSNNDDDNGEYNTMMMNNDDDLLSGFSSSSHAGASSMMHGSVEDGGNDANNGTLTNTDSSILDRMSNTNPTSSDHHDYLDDSDKGNEEDGVMGREEEENDGDMDNAHHGAFQNKESLDDGHDNDDEEEIDETWTRWKDDAGKKLQSALEDYKGHTKRLFTEIESYITKLATVDKSYASVQQSENAETSRLDQVAPDVEGATGPVLNQHHHHEQQQQQQHRHHHD
jgi:hypothetical protein